MNLKIFVKVDGTTIEVSGDNNKVKEIIKNVSGLTCVICGNKLKGNQRKACSKKCRILYGRMYAKNYSEKHSYIPKIKTSGTTHEEPVISKWSPNV